MVKRPESRKIEEHAVGFVERIFNEANWQVNQFYRDFGIDLHVKIFEDSGRRQDTPWEFYVQVKGTKKLQLKESAVRYSIDFDHLRLWSESSLPVLLIVVDVTAQSAYWLGIKEYFRELSLIGSDRRHKYKSVTLNIPVGNMLSKENLVAIRRYAQAEISYAHSHKVVSIVRWWVTLQNRHSYNSLITDDEYDEDSNLLPIDPNNFPEHPFPDPEIDDPSLAYCWGCNYIWWINKSEALIEFDEEEGGWYQYPLMYVGEGPEPDVYYFDPDDCPTCQSGQGRLDICVECGTAFFPLEDGSSEESWIREWGNIVTFEEAQELCADCWNELLLNRKTGQHLDPA